MDFRFRGETAQTEGQALPGCGHAERALQTSWWQEHGAADAGGPRAQQAGKLETWAFFAGSQGGTVAAAVGNTCAPRSVRLDLSAPAVPRWIMQWQAYEGFRVAGGSGTH